jgi:hypothetical protein
LPRGNCLKAIAQEQRVDIPPEAFNNPINTAATLYIWPLPEVMCLGFRDSVAATRRGNGNDVGATLRAGACAGPGNGPA